MNKELETQLTQFLNQGKVATYADLKQNMDFFLKLMKEVRIQLESKITDGNDKNNKELISISKALNASYKKLEDSIKISSSDSEKKISSNYIKFETELKRVESLIPKIPDLPNIKDLEDRITNRINSIKSLTADDFKKIFISNGIAIRDGLERLKGEERLDKSAIRGIETIEDDIKKIKAQPAFKVINVGSSSDSSSSSSSATGAATPIAPTSGAINSSNRAYVFATEVKVIVANGVAMRQNYGFTWDSGTSTATLDNAPSTGTDVFGYSPVTETGRDPGVLTVSDATSITPSTALYRIVHQTNTQSAGTLTINADSDTPSDGRAFTLRIDSTNIQTFSWNSQYVGGTNPLPTATSGSGKVDYLSFIYYATDSKYHFVGSALNLG